MLNDELTFETTSSKRITNCKRGMFVVAMSISNYQREIWPVGDKTSDQSV